MSYFCDFSYISYSLKTTQAMCFDPLFLIYKLRFHFEIN